MLSRGRRGILVKSFCNSACSCLISACISIEREYNNNTRKTSQHQVSIREVSSLEIHSAQWGHRVTEMTYLLGISRLNGLFEPLRELLSQFRHVRCSREEKRLKTIRPGGSSRSSRVCYKFVVGRDADFCFHNA